MIYPAYKHKYIDEATGGMWFEFGTHADGTIDLNDGTNDVITKIPRDVAAQVLKARAVFMDEMYRLLTAKE